MDDDAADASAVASPLSQVPDIDEAMLSAMPGESDRKFMNSLSQRKKRRDRRRLRDMPDVAVAAVTNAAAGSQAPGVAATPLLVEASPAALEDGTAAAALSNATTIPLPPPEFGDEPGGDEEELREEAEVVQDQMDALPGMVAHMEGRRAERQNLQYRMRTIAERVPPVGQARQTVMRLWVWASDIMAHVFDGLTLGIYRTSFGRIEGNFGSGCASFFSFIRWLFLFNLAGSCIIFAGCIFPYMALEGGLKFNKTVPPEILSDGTFGLGVLPEMVTAVRCSKRVEEKVANLSDQGTWASVTDLVTGGGWMLSQPVFLGSYINKSRAVFNVNASSDLDPLEYTEYFNTPLAMLLCLIALLASGVGAALKTSNSLYRQILKVSVRGSKSAKLSAELFTAWDYGLQAQKAARLRHRTVAMRFRSMVLHLQLKARSGSAGTLAARVLANLATAALYCSAAYLIYYTTEMQTRLTRRYRYRFRLGSTIERLVIDLMPQLTICVINVIVPLVLGKLIIFEYYSASVEILVQLGRVVFLKLLSFVTLIFTIGVVLGCSEKKRDDCGNCPNVDILCWETYVGQQLYRTLVIDVVLCLLVTPALDALRWLLNVKVGGRVFSMVPLSDLLISNEVLSLVYRQSICFVGTFFCPWLLPIACLSYGILFHIKRFTLRFMAVSNKTFRASRLERFFLDVLLLFLCVLLVPLTICVLHLHPSRGCGPYRVHQVSTGFHIASTLTNWVQWNQWKGWDLIRVPYNYTVLNPTAHLLALLMLIIFTYFFYSVIKARDTLIEFLERKLQSESKVKLELANRELQLIRMRQ